MKKDTTTQLMGKWTKENLGNFRRIPFKNLLEVVELMKKEFDPKACMCKMKLLEEREGNHIFSEYNNAPDSIINTRKGDKNFIPSFHSHLIIIDENGLNMGNIELNIQYSLVYDGLTPCNKCNLGNNFPTCRILYQIISYPKFLFVLFDLRSFISSVKRKK